MAYKVRLTTAARGDAFAAFEHIREEAPAAAEHWLRRLFDAISSLEDMPNRCPVIPEAAELGLPVRHLIFGKRSGVYGIIFDVNEHSNDGPQVRILRIWHGSRDRVSSYDVAGDDADENT